MRNPGSEALEKVGLRLAAPDQMRGTLVFEGPAVVAGRVEGTCAVGAFTYLGHGAQIRNTRFGRYCSVGPRFESAHFQHPTDWVTSHPFAYDGTRHFDFFPGYAGTVHRHPWRSADHHDLRVEVGHDVWIGARVTALKSLRIGTGAVVALGSLLRRDVPDYATWGGVPARPLSARFARNGDGADLARRLAATRWWTVEPRLLAEAPLDRPAAFLEWFDRQGKIADSFRPERWELARRQGELHLTRLDEAEDVAA